MNRFLAELKRRHVYRVAAAYAVLAWILLQLVNNVAPVLDLPIWVARAFLLALVIGFPVALFFAWMRELPSDSSATRAAATKLDYVLAGALVVVIGLVSYQQLTSSSGERTPSIQQAVLKSADPPQPAIGGISMAVLPFANLSGDASQEFFSDGITEEITSALARVQSLRMVGRSSAFQFKGQNRDLRAIGQTLNANYLIDGSVRRDGDRVRITAQLIQSDNGVSLWTESYDRQLTSVFATQEDIAQAIVGALRVPLGLGQGESLVSFRTNDLDSYQQYLRARARYRAFAFAETAAILEPVVARDPGFAPAWSLLARTYAGVRGNEPALRIGRYDDQQRRVRQAALEREEMAAREAIRLDPRHAGGYAALAAIELYQNQDWGASEYLFQQALKIDPNDSDILLSYSLNLASRGHFKQALSVAEQLRTLEPFVPANNLAFGYYLILSLQHATAISILEAIPPGGLVGYYRNLLLANAYGVSGRFQEAADTLLSMPQESPVTRRSIEEAARLIRSAPARVAHPDALPALEGELRMVYGFIGASDRAFDYAERSVEVGAVGGSGMRGLWDPQYASLRKSERFKALMRNAGLVDYWRAREWPDLCRPVGANDFECD